MNHKRVLLEHLAYVRLYGYRVSLGDFAYCLQCNRRFHGRRHTLLATHKTFLTAMLDDDGNTLGDMLGLWDANRCRVRIPGWQPTSMIMRLHDRPRHEACRFCKWASAKGNVWLSMGHYVRVAYGYES